MKTGLHCSFITFLKIGSGFLVCPKKSIFHTNTCNGMILIQGMMVKKHIKILDKKNLLLQIYLVVNYWFIYIKVIPNCCESSSVFTIPLNNIQMYAKL